MLCTIPCVFGQDLVYSGITKSVLSPEKPCDFLLRRKITSDSDAFCDFLRREAAPLQFGWRRGRLQQKIAAICDCDCWCSQFCTAKQGVVGLRLGIARKCLGIPRTEKWPKTGHADDWIYCDWVKPFRCGPLSAPKVKQIPKICSRNQYQ